MKYATYKKHYFTNAVSARSIRNELNLNEKDRPTDAGDNMKYATHEKHYFTNAVTARSIRNELDLNRKIDPLQQKLQPNQ